MDVVCRNIDYTLLSQFNKIVGKTEESLHSSHGLWCPSNAYVTILLRKFLIKASLTRSAPTPFDICINWHATPIIIRSRNYVVPSSHSCRLSTQTTTSDPTRGIKDINFLCCNFVNILTLERRQSALVERTVNFRKSTANARKRSAERQRGLFVKIVKHDDESYKFQTGRVQEWRYLSKSLAPGAAPIVPVTKWVLIPWCKTSSWKGTRLNELWLGFV